MSLAIGHARFGHHVAYTIPNVCGLPSHPSAAVDDSVIGLNCSVMHDSNQQRHRAALMFHSA